MRRATRGVRSPHHTGGGLHHLLYAERFLPLD